MKQVFVCLLGLTLAAALAVADTNFRPSGAAAAAARGVHVGPGRRQHQHLRNANGRLIRKVAVRRGRLGRLANGGDAALAVPVQLQHHAAHHHHAAVQQPVQETHRAGHQPALVPHPVGHLQQPGLVRVVQHPLLRARPVQPALFATPVQHVAVAHHPLPQQLRQVQLLVPATAAVPAAPVTEPSTTLPAAGGLTLEYGTPATVAPEVRAPLQLYGSPEEQFAVPVSTSYLPAEEEVVAIRDSYVPAEEKVVAVRDSYVPAEEEVIAISDSYLPAEEEVVAIRDIYVPAEEKVVAVRDSYVPAEVEVIAISDSYLPADEEVVSIGDSYLPAEEEVVEVEEVMKTAIADPPSIVVAKTLPSLPKVKSNIAKRKPISIIRSTYNPPAETAVFDYSFESENGIKQEARGTLRMVDDAEVSVMKGSYSYIGADNQVYEVEWYADETGFHATAPHLPQSVVPNHPEVAAAVRSQIAFAAEEDALKKRNASI